MNYLTILTAGIFGSNNLTVAQATEILDSHDNSMTLAKYIPFRPYKRAAQFLYQKEALPDSFFKLPRGTQDKIIFGGWDLTEGMIDKPDAMWKHNRSIDIAMNFNHWAPRSKLQKNCQLQQPLSPHQG